jgi:hypothetical protein
MRLGQAARVGAIGIVVDAEKGSQVNGLTLTLQEADATGQQGTGAKVRACPITDFLQPEANGPAENVPQEDCDTAHADGVRNDDGTWTFDLTPIAAAWLDPFGTIAANGIRLDPVGDPPATFQVAFTGFEDATLDADIAPGSPAADPFATGSAVGAGAFDSGSLGGTTGGTDFSAPGAEAPAVAAPTTQAPTGAAPATAEPAAASRVGQTFGNWPPAVVLLLVGVVALALAAAWTLGPAGRNRPDLARRQGGVSRALNRA